MEDKGSKHDDSKIMASILFKDFPLAIKEVSAAATYGAYLYGRDENWSKIDNLEDRFSDAKFRHSLEHFINEKDDDTGLHHLAHEIWNGLVLLETRLRKGEKKEYKDIKRRAELRSRG